jgi:hypothetical protein
MGIFAILMAVFGLVACAAPQAAAPNIEGGGWTLDPPPSPAAALPPGPGAPPLAGVQINPELSARDIVERATLAAGGETWRRPKTLYLRGYAIFYDGGQARIHERHEMWRVYPDFKPNAHGADGKVRIDSYRDGALVTQLAFDGERTWTQDGVQPPSAADRQWSENFGFGVIRFALDDGYRLERLMDEWVDGVGCHLIMVIDPTHAETLFCISARDFSILKVGFVTPRGWHERIYSDFYRKPGVDWVQPRRVRLLYNGVKQNEIIWTDFILNAPMPDAMFTYSSRP